MFQLFSHGEIVLTSAMYKLDLSTSRAYYTKLQIFQLVLCTQPLSLFQNKPRHGKQSQGDEREETVAPAQAQHFVHL